MKSPPTAWDSAIGAAVEHALDAYPEESCGFVVENIGELTYVACRNAADFPRRSFSISPLRYVELLDAGRTPVGLIHSHPDGTDTLSAEDIRGATLPGPDGRVESYPGLLWIVVAAGEASASAISAYRWDEEAEAFVLLWRDRRT